MENVLKVVLLQLAMIQWTTFTGSAGISSISQCHKADDHFTLVSQTVFGPKIAIVGDGQGLGCERLEIHRQIQVCKYKQPASDNHPWCHSSLQLLRTRAFRDHRDEFTIMGMTSVNKSDVYVQIKVPEAILGIWIIFLPLSAPKQSFTWSMVVFYSRTCRKLDSIE